MDIVSKLDNFYLGKILVLFLCLFIIFNLTNIFTHFVLADRTSYELPFGYTTFSRGLTLPWLNFDGLNYLAIVSRGYSSNAPLVVFYPLFPILVGVLSLNGIISPIYVGLFISFVASLASIIFIYKISAMEYGHEIGFKSILLLMLFPASYYLFAYYTEGLFLLLSVLSLYFMKKNNFALATLFVALATATKLFGLSLVVVLLFKSYKYFKEHKQFPLVVFASPLGFVLYSFYLLANFGNPFAMFLFQADEKFRRSISALNPFMAIPNAFANILKGSLASYDSPFVYPVMILEFTTVAYIIVVLVLSFKKISREYWLYMFISFCLILAGGTLSSVMRYAFVLFPAFIFLSLKLKGRSFIVWSLISFMLLLFSSTLFFRNYWIA